MGLFLTIIIAGIVVKYFDEILTLIGAGFIWLLASADNATKERAAAPIAPATQEAKPEKKRFWTWKKFALIAVALFLIAIH